MEPAINIKFLALPKNERRQLAQFFRKLLKFFIENEIVAVATAGTLLGLTRHGDIMAYDDYIDMLIDRTNLKKLQHLFVDYKFIFKDGTSKITFKLTKTRKNQYAIHKRGIVLSGHSWICLLATWELTQKRRSPLKIILTGQF